MDKVSGGTPKGFTSLCKTCRNAQVMRGLNLQEELHCHATYYRPKKIEFPVETCSAYDDKRVPSLWQMEKIAWEVVSRSRGPVGFAGGMTNEIIIRPPKSDEETPGQPAKPTAEKK